nr:hypothetical protein [Tanacetum cinerariifolium]
GDMSGSGAGEMAPTSSKAVVLPKFDMHVYTSELTSSELEAAVADYLIPMDLHPRLPPPGMTMDKLPSWAIGFLSRIKSIVDEVERLSEFLVPLRTPPRHLLYVCGLTTACRHPGLSYSIKDQDKNVISMDTFLKLPTWTGTIVSKGDPILEDQRQKPRVTPPLPEGSKIPNLTAFQRSVEMPNTKIATAREKKDRALLELRLNALVSDMLVVQGRNERFRNRISPLSPDRMRLCLLAPFVKLILKPLRILLPSFLPKFPRGTACRKGAQSHQSSHQVHEFVELVNHVTTPAEDEFLGTLSNVEVLIRAYQTLGQSVVAQGELLKRHEQLNHDYVDLRNRCDIDLAELERLRSGLRKVNQDKDEITKKFTLLDNAHSECTSREKELLDMVKELERERDEWRATALDQVEQIRHLERDLEPKTQQLIAVEEKVKMLEHERLALSAQLSQSEADRKKLVKEFIPTVVKRLHTSVEYRKSLAAPVQLCFTVGWLGGLARPRRRLCVSFPRLKTWISRGPMHPDAPSPEGVTLGGTVDSTVHQPPSTSPKTTSDIPFGTTT